MTVQYVKPLGLISTITSKNPITTQDHNNLHTNA